MSGNKFFWQETLNDSILYVRYRKCSGRENLRCLKEHFKNNPKYQFTDEQLARVPEFKPFEKEVLKNLNDEKIKYLIFDIRGNGGGTSPQGTKLIEKIARIHKINQPESLFVLTDYKNYSSATINIIDFKNKTNAILIGGIPKGTPNHFGEIEFLKLPNTGIYVSYSTKHFSRKWNGENLIKPDIIVEPSKVDYIKGKDIVLDYTLNRIFKN